MRYLLEKELDTFKRSEDISERKSAVDNVCHMLRDKRIIIYGAGDIGRTLLPCMNRLNINTLFFIDKRYEEIREVCGVKVCPIDELEGYTGDDITIIIAVDSVLFREYQDEIEYNIARSCSEACVVREGRTLALMLKYQRCMRDYGDGREFDLTECIRCGGEKGNCDVFNNYLMKITPRSDIDKRSFPLKFNKYVGFIMGNVCTLRCRCCCEMVPYYAKKNFADADNLIEDCRRVADAAQFTMYMELVGGEPFLHPKIEYILNELLKIPDVGYIKVFTNGTVVPDEQLLRVLKDPRIVIVWSNYQNSLSKELWSNVEKTRELLEQADIPYLYSVSRTWLDFSSFDYSDKTEEMLESDFDDCFISTCHRVYEGVLYRCPHHYAAARLGKGEYSKDGCVVLSEAHSPYELSVKLCEFKEQRYVDACRYCVVPHKAKEVPAGEQLEE